MSEFSLVEQEQIQHSRRMIKPITNIEAAQEIIPQPDEEDIDPDPYGVIQEAEQQLGIDILPQRWKANPDDSRWVKRFISKGRKATVAKLYMNGSQYQR